MLITTHIAVTILLCLALRLDREEWFVAMMFGVMIDMDHLFAAPGYVSRNGWGALLRPTWDDGSGLPWKSQLHYPVGAFVVAPLSIGWRYFIPALFWSTHLGLDYIQSAALQWSLLTETAVMTSACVGIVLVLYSSWKDARPEGDFRQFLEAVELRLSKCGSSIRGVLGSIV